MSYTVLARKFRSQTFDEVVGQAPITTTLRNAITGNRVHHGYLFTGTRGVGKTSMARILAKCLNCLKAEGPTVTPCGKCDSCLAIARGEDIDVIEIDAASNTGVDNIRELRSNAVFRPARSRFKVYIIDEVHMLSTAAFNALLKTLEEPPSHVKFIFATTEIQKVPATIQSRVQRFDFRSIPAGEISEQLARICKSEKVKADEAALKRIARLANGSMRDALSLLDQVLSMSADGVTAAVVDELLPATHDELLARLIDRIAEHDAAGALAVVDQSLGQGHTLDLWCSLLLAQFRDLMLMRVCGADTDLVDVPAALRSSLESQSQKFDAGSYVYMITLLEELRRSVKSSGSGRALVEAAVVRMADAANFSSIESLIAQVAGASPSSGASTMPARQAAPPAPRAVVESLPAKKKEVVPAESHTAGIVDRSSPLDRNRVGTAPAIGDPDRVPGTYRAGPALPVGNMADSPAAISGRRVTQADLKAAHAEPMVRAALEVFNGRIVDVQNGPPMATARPEPAPVTPDAEP